MYVSPEVIAEVKRIIADSEITKEDDREWPEGDRCVHPHELSIKPLKREMPTTLLVYN